MNISFGQSLLKKSMDKIGNKVSNVKLQKMYKEQNKIVFVQKPIYNLPPAIKTYSIVLNDEPLAFSKNQYYDKLYVLQGYRRVNDNADLVIKLNKLKKGKPVREVTKTQKTLTGLNYYYDVDYTKPVWRLQFIHNEKIIFEEETKPNNVTLTYGKDKQYLNTNALKNSWFKDREDFIATQEEVLNSLDNFVKNYSLQYKEFNYTICSINSKKQDYSDFNKTYLKLKTAMNLLSQNKIAHTNKLLRPVHQNFLNELNTVKNDLQKIASEYKENEKALRINKKIANEIYKTLAYICVFEENFEDAVEFQNIYKSTLPSAGKTKDQERLQAFISDQQKRFEANLWRNEITYSRLADVSLADTVPKRYIIPDFTSDNKNLFATVLSNVLNNIIRRQLYYRTNVYRQTTNSNTYNSNARTSTNNSYSSKRKKAIKASDRYKK